MLTFSSTINSKAHRNNVTVGGTEAWLGTYLASATDATDLDFLGGTFGALEWMFKRSYLKLVCDQFMNHYGVFPVGEDVEVKGTFQEDYLKNVRRLFGNVGNTLTAGGPPASTADVSGTLLIGEDKSQAVFQLVTRGPAPSGYGVNAKRIGQWWQASPTAASNVKIGKTEERRTQVTFSCAVDPSAFIIGSRGAVGQLIDA